MCNIKSNDIEGIIKKLEDAIKVCYEVDCMSEESERSYPYAAGYSRVAMQGVRDELRRLM